MTKQEIAYRKRIAAMLKKNNDMVMADDGYYVYWPTAANRGYSSSHDLRIIADILDAHNKKWDAQVKKDLGNG